MHTHTHTHTQDQMAEIIAGEAKKTDARKKEKREKENDRFCHLLCECDIEQKSSM